MRAFRLVNRLARTSILVLLAGLVLGTAAPSASAQTRLSDQQIANGFYRTVFGLEYAGGTLGASVVKKFTGPVRLYIDHRARIDRRAAVSRFVRQVASAVRGLDLRLVDSPLDANFIVYVVDRAHYAQVIQDDIYNSPRAEIRGRCMVRVLTSRGGISKAQAVIVSDEGDFLFERCMVEEILQGLGPLNDDDTLSLSVLNDTSQLARFTLHDRYILNVLYDHRVLPGMRMDDVAPILPQVIADLRGQVR